MAESAEESLDQLIRRVDPDRWLTSRFVADETARADILAVYAFDHELARARQAASTQLLAEIRLTWWREVVDQIFAGDVVRRHPVAQALAHAARRRGLPRALLEAMVDGQIEALEDGLLDRPAAVTWAKAVEGSAARLVAMVLDPPAPAEAAAPAGRAWGLALLLRSNRAPAGILRPLLRDALDEARKSADGLSVEALPAALPAALARFDLAGRAPGALTKRLCLILAAATGKV